jgi:hypothetical protein
MVLGDPDAVETERLGFQYLAGGAGVDGGVG